MVSDRRVDFTAATPPLDSPLTDLTDAQLCDHCLPPRPNEKIAPQAYDNWRSMLSRGVVFEKTGQLTTRRAGPMLLRSPLGNTAAVPETARKAKETSKNWSGCYLRQFGNGRYKLLQGAWVVPGVTPGRALSGPGPAVWKSSIWIGLDGYDQASRSMPQLGTEQMVRYDNGKPIATYATWLWWWTLGEQPQLPWYPPLAIGPNECIFAQITVLDAMHVNLALCNITQKKAVAYTVASPQLPAEGRTAEWIVERPLDPDTLRFFALPTYGSVTFTQCIAISEGPDGETPQQLDAAHLIRMKDWDDPQHPGTVVSDADRVGSDNLRITM
jgi:hypothetical protein